MFECKKIIKLFFFCFTVLIYCGNNANLTANVGKIAELINNDERPTIQQIQELQALVDCCRKIIYDQDFGLPQDLFTGNNFAGPISNLVESIKLAHQELQQSVDEFAKEELKRGLGSVANTLAFMIIPT